jgi:hypothetical protein
MVAGWVNPPTPDIASTLGGTHFAPSAIEFVALAAGRAFIHTADDAFCEVDNATYQAWAAGNNCLAVRSLDYHIDDLTPSYAAGESPEVTVVVRHDALVAVARCQRSKDGVNVHRHELFTACGYTLTVESADDLAAAALPAWCTVGKFLVWRYDPMYRSHRKYAWAVTIRRGAVESVTVSARADWGFAEVYFKNGTHYLEDVMLEPAIAGDVQDLFLGTTNNYSLFT